MQAYLPTLYFNDGSLPSFNPLIYDWTTEPVTSVDLLSYAKTNESNNFTQPQGFTQVDFNEHLNGVSVETFGCINGLTSNAQEQLDVLKQKTTNVTFDGNKTTLVSETLSTQVLKINNQNINTMLNNVQSDISAMQTKLTGLSYSSATNTTTMSNIACSTLQLNGTDLGSRLTSSEATIAANTQGISALQTSVASLSTKADDALVLHLDQNETVTGIVTFTQAPRIGSFPVVSTNDLSAAVNNMINADNGIYERMSQLSALLASDVVSINTILTNMVDLTSTQTISGLKTFASLVTFAAVTVTDLVASTITAPLSYFKQVINNELVTNNVITNTVLCDKLVCNDVSIMNPSTPYPCIYLTNQGLVYPLFGSGAINDLSGIDMRKPILVTVMPSYEIIFYDTNKSALARIYNPEAKPIYNVSIRFTANVASFFISRIQ